MKKEVILLFLFLGALVFQSRAQCTFSINNTSNDTTFIISSNTTLSCINTPPVRSFLICPNVTVTYLDNSCMHKFYLEPGAELIYDSTASYGYSQVFAKAGSIVDFNNRQVMKVHYENGAVLIDTAMTIMNDSLCSGVMSFDYSQLPNGTGCAATGIAETQIQKIELFPNPAHDQVHLIVKSFIPGSSYTIYDCTGRIVQAEKITGEETLISTALLKRGFYLVRITGKINSHIVFGIE